MIYAKITPNFSIISRYRKVKDFYGIYELIHSISGCHEIAEKCANWCEFATIGETYETNLFIIEIIED